MAFAYTTSTISGSRIGANSPVDLMRAIGSYLQTGLGWTLVEDRSTQAGANSKFILRSNGEDNAASTFYFVMTSGLNYVGLQGATFWDTGAHTPGSGVASPTADSTVTLRADEGKNVHYWISGDRDSFNLISRVNGSYDGSHFGRITQFTTPVNDPFPIYLTGTNGNSVDVIGSATNQAYSFLDGTTALSSAAENEWDALYPTPLGSAEAPDNIFGAVEKFICMPILAGVSDSSPVRRSVRGFAKNVWATVGPNTTSLTPEDVFAASTGRTYQVFFDGPNNTVAYVIRRS